MKKITINEFGGPEKLILYDIPKPSAGDGQIVKVHIGQTLPSKDAAEAHRQL